MYRQKHEGALVDRKVFILFEILFPEDDISLIPLRRKNEEMIMVYSLPCNPFPMKQDRAT